MIFVCAAGNEERDIDLNPVYPASINSDNVISVGAVNEDKKNWIWSNYGNESVDLYVKGVDIETISANESENDLIKVSGTSIASAQVSFWKTNLLNHMSAKIGEMKSDSNTNVLNEATIRSSMLIALDDRYALLIYKNVMASYGTGYYTNVALLDSFEERIYDNSVDIFVDFDMDDVDSAKYEIIDGSLILKSGRMFPYEKYDAQGVLNRIADFFC